MKHKCDTCEGYRDDCQCVEERIASALERIAVALEKTPPVTYNYLSPAPLGIPAGAPQGGYYCSVCWTYVLNGVSHSCMGRVTYTSDPNTCSYTTAAGTRCTLEAGHEHAHFTLGM